MANYSDKMLSLHFTPKCLRTTHTYKGATHLMWFLGPIGANWNPYPGRYHWRYQKGHMRNILAFIIQVDAIAGWGMWGIWNVGGMWLLRAFKGKIMTFILADTIDGCSMLSASRPRSHSSWFWKELRFHYSCPKKNILYISEYSNHNSFLCVIFFSFYEAMVPIIPDFGWLKISLEFLWAYCLRWKTGIIFQI